LTEQYISEDGDEYKVELKEGLTNNKNYLIVGYFLVNYNHWQYLLNEDKFALNKKSRRKSSNIGVSTRKGQINRPNLIPVK